MRSPARLLRHAQESEQAQKREKGQAKEIEKARGCTGSCACTRETGCSVQVLRGREGYGNDRRTCILGLVLSDTLVFLLLFEQYVLQNRRMTFYKASHVFAMFVKMRTCSSAHAKNCSSNSFPNKWTSRISAASLCTGRARIRLETQRKTRRNTERHTHTECGATDISLQHHASAVSPLARGDGIF